MDLIIAYSDVRQRPSTLFHRTAIAALLVSLHALLLSR